MTAPDPLQPCRRHDWRPDDPDQPTAYTCADCPATAHPCRTCPRPLEHATTRTCDRCISNARNCVRDIRDLYAQLPDVVAAIGGLHAIRYDRGGTGRGTGTDTTIIGGDALVMAAPGALGPVRIDPALYAIEAKDPAPVLTVLAGWEDAWRAEQHHRAAERTSVAAAAEYLVVHAAWAAQHSDTWGDFVEETRALRWRLRILTGDDRRPVTETAPCVHCGGRVVRHWTDGGLDDTRVCDECGMTWPNGERLRHTNHLRVLAAPVTDPDTLVTVEQARLALPDLKRNTINQVLKRDRDRTNPEHEDYDPTWVPRLPVQGRNVRGECLYRLGDFTALTPQPAMQEETA